MWYWIIAGSIFLFLEVLELNNCYDAGESINDISISYTMIALLIALLFPLVIIFIISYYISCFIVSILKEFKRKN
jgi:hypothetical protein